MLNMKNHIFVKISSGQALEMLKRRDVSAGVLAQSGAHTDLERYERGAACAARLGPEHPAGV
jgi:hypothetical protein